MPDLPTDTTASDLPNATGSAQPAQPQPLHFDPSATPQPQKTDRKLILMSMGILVVLLLIAGLLGYQLLASQSLTPQSVSDLSTSILPSQSSDTETDQVTTQTDQTQSQSDPLKRLVFSRNVGTANEPKLQAWIMNPDGTNPQQLALPEFSSLFKQPESSLIFYTPKVNREGTFFVKNLVTDETTKHTVISHPSPEIYENLNLYEINNIAPDGSAVVFQIDFFEDCPPITPAPGFQGGYGPCQPDPDPNLPWGFYLYDLKTKESTFLTDTFQPSRWDMKNRLLYYIDHTYDHEGKKAGLYRFDLATKQKTQVEIAPTFGYGAFPLFRENTLIRLTGMTENNGQSSWTKLVVSNPLAGDDSTIDEDTWGRLQPFAAVSPDESHFLYQRTPLVNGLTTAKLHRYIFATNESIQLTPSSNQLSYSIRGVWVDEHTFVTLVDTVETENYHNDNNYLVSIDTLSGEITRLTPKDDVYRFNPN